jgi:hypothetical protein
MALTVKESFRQFASNLNITDNQGILVSLRRKKVVDAIEKKLYLHTSQPSRLIGSYDRDTHIKYLSEGDIDVMIVLHYGKHNEAWDNKEGVTKVLNRFKTILEESYPKITCSVDRNCVVMKFSEFKLDVVPAFRFTDGDHKIPDTYRGAWLRTSPVKFSKEVTRINKNMDGDFIPLIKMVKGWNRNYTKQLRGFHIECLMLKHYKNYDKSYTFDSMLNVFFSKLPSYLKSPSYDPITSDRVDLYLDNSGLGYKRENFINRAKKISIETEEAFEDRDKYPILAIKKWKEILGEFFPAYG